MGPRILIALASCCALVACNGFSSEGALQCSPPGPHWCECPQNPTLIGVQECGTNGLWITPCECGPGGADAIVGTDAVTQSDAPTPDAGADVPPAGPPPTTGWAISAGPLRAATDSYKLVLHLGPERLPAALETERYRLRLGPWPEISNPQE